MGWFKRRADSTEQIDELKASIAAMAERLERADADQRQLDRKIDEKVDGVATQVGEQIDQKVSGATAQLDQQIHAQVDGVAAQLGQRVDGIASRLDEKDNELPPPPVVEPADVDSLRERIDRMATRLDEVDRRITSISTELANQLSEISNDLEAMGGKEPPTDEVVDELRDAQTRLANEQARYQIAFRHDLADLADRLRRS